MLLRLERRVLVVGRLSIGLYAAAFGVHVDYVDTDQQRLTAAERLGVVVHDWIKDKVGQVPGSVSRHCAHLPRIRRRYVLCGQKASVLIPGSTATPW